MRSSMQNYSLEKGRIDFLLVIFNTLAGFLFALSVVLYELLSALLTHSKSDHCDFFLVRNKEQNMLVISLH